MNKHVFEKIAKLEKTELSEVKVDLALVDDIAKMLKNVTVETRVSESMVSDITKLSNAISTADADIKRKEKELNDTKTELGKSYGKSLTALQTMADKQMKLSDKLENQAIAVIKKAQAAAEGLGVDPNAIKGLSELTKLTDDLEGWKLQIESDIKKIPFADFLQF